MASPVKWSDQGTGGPSDVVGTVRAIIAGGGTGGHVFPGVALAQALRECGDAEVLFVGTARGLEFEVAPRAGFRLATIPAQQVRGGGIWRALRGAVAATWAIAAALRIMARFRPDIVVGVGGYASAPMVVAAWLVRVPTLLLEQNVIPGATNRLLGRLARLVCVSFPETATSFAGAKVVCTGNPVRSEIVRAADRRRGGRDVPDGKSPLTLLVIGGSAGAHRLNVVVVEAIGRLGSQARRLRVLHQTGKADADSARAGYTALGVDADVQPFFAEMASVYESADLAVCRAGATTIAELVTVGLPSILVPYPYATDDHQRRNAEAVAAVGAGILILDRELTAERLSVTLLGLIEDPLRRQEMGDAAQALARPDAGRVVAEQCAALVARATG